MRNFPDYSGIMTLNPFNDSETITESVMKSDIDKDHKQKGSLKVSSFRREYLDETLRKKYRAENSIFKHIRPGDHKKKNAYVFFDKKNLVAVLAVEECDDGHTWITDIHILPEYRGYGLSTQLLDIAVKEHHADALGVHPDNAVALRVYEKYGFKISPESINDVKSGKTKTYRMYLHDDKGVTESVKDGGIIEDAQDLYTYLCKNFEYGCPKNGKVYDYEGYEFFQNYKHTSPEQFKKCGGGVCWDYVGFESYWFSKHSGRYTAETYYIEMNNKESATHTFLLYKDKEKDDSHWYYFEVSWQSHRGIYKAKSKEALIQFVVYNMTKRYSGDYEVYKYNHIASLYGKNTIDFMNTIVKTGTEIKAKASKPAGVERIKLGAEIVSEETISDQLDTMMQLLMPGC